MGAQNEGLIGLIIKPPRLFNIVDPSCFFYLSTLIKECNKYFVLVIEVNQVDINNFEYCLQFSIEKELKFYMRC